jgi:orotidine-5'-phosphate decarboxylase
LFEADRREAISAQKLVVVTPGVGVAQRATNQYMVGPNTSVHFLNVRSAGSVVVEDRDREAVVFHRIVSPP